MSAAGGIGNPSGEGQPRDVFFVVDRREGSILVIVDDAGAEVNVEANQLHPDCRPEGAVLRVPKANSFPDWKRATRDRTEEGRRAADALTRIRKLEQSDTGGDIAL
jgi:Protein of unknown function (DUF3006).